LHFPKIHCPSVNRHSLHFPKIHCPSVNRHSSANNPGREVKGGKSRRLTSNSRHISPLCYSRLRHIRKETSTLNNTAAETERLRAAYLCDGMMRSSVRVFIYDIELQTTTQTMDGWQASFYLNTVKLPNRVSS
jgi:hypothetical protein